jgi:hypothetical protein
MPRTRRNPELLPGSRRTLVVYYGPSDKQTFIVDPGTTSWTRAAEFINRHFPGFRLVRDKNDLAGGHFSDVNGISIVIW